MRAFIDHSARPEPGFDINFATQSPDTDQAFFVPPTKVSFGPFGLLPKRLFLLEGEKRPVPLRSRAREILNILLERRAELVSEQDLMSRVWPKVLVESANFTVHVFALCRALSDGRDEHRPDGPTQGPSV